MAKEVHKLQQLSDGDSNPHIQELKVHYSQLVGAHNDLVEAFNNNNKNFSSIQQQLDIRLGAAYSVIQDLFDSLENIGAGYTACVHTVPVLDAEVKSIRRVDWPRYIQRHIDTLQAEFARIKAENAAACPGGALEQLVSHLAEQPEASPLHTPDIPEEDGEEAPATIFGGDHAQAQPQD